MLRPESWTGLAGGSPVSVGTGAPGSRPWFVGEIWRAERGVKSLFGGSKCAGRSVKRTLQRDLTLMLVYEATRDAACETVAVRTPLAETTGCRLANPPLLVPVLRAGLGMVDQAHALIPEARVGFVGVARDEETHEPTQYLESLPDDLSTQPVMVLDPMLATGGSMAHTIGLLHSRNAVDITAVCVVCAPEGIAALEKVAPNVRLVTATIDERLNDIAYIVPGLGDAGDRQFGPR